MKPRFAIGTKFHTMQKNKKVAEVVDILTTTNAAGEVVKITYVGAHEFMGQKIKAEYNDTNIARRLLDPSLLAA